MSQTHEIVAPEAALKKPRRSKRRTNWYLLGTLTALGVGWAVHVFLVPELLITVFHWRYPKRFLPPELEMPFAQRCVLRTCEYLFVFWFFFLGACIGSFFNVVASRLPRNRSIVFGGSKCPYCDTRLNLLDNLPFFGWIALRGRCRTCKLPISPRYLIIEIIVGAIFTTIALFELISGGANIPNHMSYQAGGVVSTVFYPQWDLIAASVTHAMLYSVLVMLTATHLDGMRFPLLPLLFIGITFAVAVVSFPILNAVEWSEPAKTLSFFLERPIVSRLLAVLLGMAFGGLAAWISHVILVRSQPKIDLENNRPSEITLAQNFSYHWFAMHILVGVVIGWQSILSLALLGTIGTRLILPRTEIRRLDRIADRWLIQRQAVTFGCFIGFALLHHFFWRQIMSVYGI